MSTPGFSGSSYDRSVESNSSNTSTLLKMKETYWITKQAVIQKLGKKEDSHVVASDSQLDSKLEVFKAIQESTMTLLDVIEKYQIRLCAAAQEENAMGRYLKSHCSNNKTRAAKMMAAVGKSQSMSAQERLSLRVPLVRLYQEVETFRYRAISDTLINVHRMEGARTQYRGALLWMKKVSEDLDPDTFKQLEKFRKVQSQVRKSKHRFDKLKLDVMQKVDLLAASRCNMFSHVLAQYQAALLAFWKNTAHTMSAVAHNFKGYQYYEFNILRELTDTTRKLAEETNRDTKEEVSELEEVTDDEELIDINDDPLEIGNDDSAAALRKVKDARGSPKLPDGLLWQEDGGRRGMNAQMQKGHEDLMALTEGGKKEEEFTAFMSFEDDNVNLDELGAELGKENVAKPQQPKTLGELGIHQNTKTASGQEQDPEDDLSLLNLILNAPSEGEDEFAQEWQGLFGEDPINVTPHTMPAERDPSQQQQRQAQFMPSSLMDLDALQQPSSASAASAAAAFSMFGEEGSGAGMVKGPMVESSSLKLPSSTNVKSSPMSAMGSLPAHQEQKKDMSAWISLFADLDPLSNPDAVGRRQTDDGSGNL